MPFDANGNFSLVPGTIVADGLNILPSQHNPPFQDVANGLSQAVVRDGRAPMTGPLNMNGYKITGVAAGDAPDDVVTNAAIADLGVAIGDGKWSVRDLSPNWLRRDGSLYNIGDYPELASLMPVLADGIAWDARSLPTTTSYSLVQYTDRWFVGANNNILSSPDGRDWDIVQTFEGVNTITGLATGLGIVVGVAISGRVVSSPDGNVWSASNSSIPPSGGLQSVAFSPSLELFVAVGGNGNCYTSDDGTTWTSRTSGVSTTLRSIKWLDGTFVAVGDSGTVITSTNGTTWTSRTTGVSAALYGVTFAGGTFIACGASGTIITSTNLAGWTARVSGTSVSLWDAEGTSSGFLVVGQSGVVRISTNGTSWSSAPTGVSADLRSIVADRNNDDRFIAISSGSTIALIGLRTSPTQFRVPNDDPTYGWIRAL